jgi:hypothetical protein
MRIARIAYQRRSSYGILDGGQVRLLRGAPFNGIRESGGAWLLKLTSTCTPPSPMAA